MRVELKIKTNKEIVDEILYENWSTNKDQQWVSLDSLKAYIVDIEPELNLGISKEFILKALGEKE